MFKGEYEDWARKYGPYMYKADNYFEHKQYKKTIECLDKCLEIDPGDAELWFYKGRALRFLGQLKDSFFYFNKAAELDPYDTEYQVMKEYVANELKKFGTHYTKTEKIKLNIKSEYKGYEEYGSFVSSAGELSKPDSTHYQKTDEIKQNNDSIEFITDSEVMGFEETRKTIDYLKKLLLGYSDDEDNGDKIFNNSEKRMFLSKVNTIFITDGDDVSFEEPATFFVGIYSPKIRILDMIFAIILTPQGCSVKATLNQFMELAQEFAKRGGGA
ncbi:MAG: tetratricopeptide repeat protein [Treponema sp.]|jgi:tetratricopeptide (TPR) repeat protein|nr:tetratricopeptide repeat protein [Treponema sp.]